MLAHLGPTSPHHLWAAWNGDPLVWIALLGAALVYLRGVRRRPRSSPARGRSLLFGEGLVSLAIALGSPLDALSDALASAHMVQHLLLIVLATPLLVASKASASLNAGLPRPLARALGRGRRALRRRWGTKLVRQTPTVAVVHVVAVWFWHAAGPYQAALGHPALHVVEHTTFLVTALAMWAAVLHGAGASRPVVGPVGSRSVGVALLVLFCLSVQSALLGALLTFAARPWYGAYAATTDAWGLSPLTDQQLAGVIMWVPGGVVYVAVALWLLTRWLDSPTLGETAPTAGLSPRTSDQPSPSAAPSR